MGQAPTGAHNASIDGYSKRGDRRRDQFDWPQHAVAWAEYRIGEATA
jgi:hypothetical protein